MRPTSAVRQRIERVPAAPPSQAQGETSLITSYAWFWYLLSLFVPFSGIFLALFFYDQESREVRKVGRNCLLVGFVVWILLPLFFLMALVLAGVAALANLLSDLMPLAG